jgi:hypothetical protein
MLLELLEHPGEVMTRERLVQILWPKGIVDFDNSLNAVVRKLRSALGDDPDTPRYIETLPRIGYRFVGKIESPAAILTGGPKIRKPWLALLLLFGALIAMTLFLRSGGRPRPSTTRWRRPGSGSPATTSRTASRCG